MSLRMPFGKHAGVPITELAQDYLEWADEQDWIRQPLKDAIETELDRRAAMQNLQSKVDRHIVEEIVTAGLRSLSKQHHPDLGGSSQTMSAVNAAAHWIREQAKGL